MFALAFYNKTTKELILQEIQITKTIILRLHKDKLYFSSEIKKFIRMWF